MHNSDERDYEEEEANRRLLEEGDDPKPPGVITISPEQWADMSDNVRALYTPADSSGRARSCAARRAEGRTRCLDPRCVPCYGDDAAPWPVVPRG